MTQDETPLVGRTTEIVRLTALLEIAAQGTARFVLIEGEPGIGKSRLLDEMAGEAIRRGFVLRTARTVEFEHERAFALIAQALGPDLAIRVPVGTEDIDAPASPVQFHVIDRVVELVGAAATGSPLLLAFDDVQWADPASLATIEAVVRRLATERVLVLAASRPIPRSAELARLTESLGRRVERLRLEPLTDEAVRQLSEQVAGRPVSDGLARHAAGAGGNPFFVSELIRALVDDGLVQVVDGRADIRAPTVPASLRATVVRRLGFLPDDTLDLLRWGAVLGSAFAVDEVAAQAQRPMPAVVRQIDPAIRAEVLVEQADLLGFRHDLVREAVYADIPRAVRAGMHLRVAQQRLAAGGRPLDVAPHLARGVTGRDVASAELMRLAAGEVAVQSPLSAVELLRRGLEMTAAGDATRDAILFDLVRALLWSGSWRQADALAREVLDRNSSAPKAAALRYVLARSLAYRGRIGDAIDEVETALATPATSEAERARLLADLSLRRPLAGDVAGGAEAARTVLAMASADDRLARRTALSGLALAQGLSGAASEAVLTARQALPVSEESAAEAVELVQPTFFLSIALIGADEFDEAAARLQRMRERTDEVGMLWSSALSGILLAEIGYRTGDWAMAQAEAETAVELSGETGTLVWSLRAIGLLATLAARRGQQAQAVALLRRGDELVASTGTAHFGLDRWLTAKFHAARANGDVDGSVSALGKAWDECEARGWVASRSDIGPPLVRLALETDQPTLAERVAEAVSEAANLVAAAPSMLAAARRCEGILAADSGALTEAGEIYRSVGRRPDAAATQEDLGRVHAASGRTADARRALEQSLGVYGEIGADTDRRRVEQMLRQLGVRRGATGPRQRPTTGWSSLTGSERQIARLAAEGLTNREIGRQLYVSHRTVATHLAHIFGKLGLSSRIELAAAVARGKLADS